MQTPSADQPQDFATLPDNGSQASNTSPLGSQAPPRALPALKKRSAVQVLKSTSSGSPEDQSEDVEHDGETGTSRNTKPGHLANAKRVRRYLSNRVSVAKRSRRRRKQAYATAELEKQVSRLRVEESLLARQLADINQKCIEAILEGVVLKARLEKLKQIKVKSAKEAVPERLTGEEC